MKRQGFADSDVAGLSSIETGRAHPTAISSQVVWIPPVYSSDDGSMVRPQSTISGAGPVRKEVCSHCGKDGQYGGEESHLWFGEKFGRYECGLEGIDEESRKVPE